MTALATSTAPDDAVVPPLGCAAMVTDDVAHVLAGAGRRLARRHVYVRRDGASDLDCWLARAAGPAVVQHGAVAAWLEIPVRAYTACGGRLRSRAARRHVELVLAAFGASICAVDVLDDVADGDAPDCGRQAPNLALALLGESIGLLGGLPPPLAGLPPPLAGRLQRLWSAAWTRCATAQARDVALTGLVAPAVEDALVVAEGSGLLTRWAVEAGALLAGAPPALVTPLAIFGQHLGTAEKLLHDLHDVWPGSQRSDDLARPSCNLALVAARQMGLLPATGHLDDETALRERLLAAGVLHYAWVHADRYRLAAAAALQDFARAGGDPAPLRPILALSPDLHVVQSDDAEL